MIYSIIVNKRAKADINELLEWLTPSAPDTSDRWLKRLTSSIRSLEKFPERCQLLEEYRKVKRKIHRLLFGRNPNCLRIIFVIEQNSVRILRVLRAQRGPLTRRQLEEMLRDEE